MVSNSHKGYSSERIRLNLFVFGSSAISIGIFGLLFVLFPKKSQFWLTYIQEQANQLFGWYYMLVIVACLGFVGWLAFLVLDNFHLEKMAINLSLVTWLGYLCCFPQVSVLLTVLWCC